MTRHDTRALTDGVHEATVDVGVEKVGHGEDSAVAEGVGAVDLDPPGLVGSFGVLHNVLRTIVQKVHEECEVPCGGWEVVVGGGLL